MTARPGLVRWRPVDGATSYQVWYPDIRKSFSTHTNVADQREFYLFHDDPNWYSTVRWRVRAVRHVLGQSPNGLPAVSYGPWSPVYSTTNPSLSSGKLDLRATVSDVVSTGWKDGAHQLMPALTFSGNEDLHGQEWPLFRVYAFTDRDCVNVVFRGSVVGGAAFAPRTGGPVKLPANSDELDLASVSALPSADTEAAKTFMADGSEVLSSESLSGDGASKGVKVDLPDVDAKTTRYYWTVVPVGISVDDSGSVHVRRRRPPAGRLRGRARLDLREALPPRDHALRRRLRVRPDAQGPPPGERRRTRRSCTRARSSPGGRSSPRRPTRSSGRAACTRGAAQAIASRSPRRRCSTSAPGAGTTGYAG